MRASVRHAEGLAVRAPGRGPRIGRAVIDVVEEHGVNQLQFDEVNQAQRAAVDPAAIDLCGGQMKARDLVGHAAILAVGRDAHVPQQAAAVGQGDFLHDLAAGGVDNAYRGGDDILVRAACVKVVGYEEELAVQGDCGGDWLARDLRPLGYSLCGEVDKCHLV